MNHATGPASPPGTARREHWDAVYSSRGEQKVSDEQHRTQSGIIQPFTWITARLS